MENQQTDAVNELQSLRERISQTLQGDIKLYFIVRMLRDIILPDFQTVTKMVA